MSQIPAPVVLGLWGLLSKAGSAPLAEASSPVGSLSLSCYQVHCLQTQRVNL